MDFYTFLLTTSLSCTGPVSGQMKLFSHSKRHTKGKLYLQTNSVERKAAHTTSQIPSITTKIILFLPRIWRNVKCYEDHKLLPALFKIQRSEYQPKGNSTHELSECCVTLSLLMQKDAKPKTQPFESETLNIKKQTNKQKPTSPSELFSEIQV